MSIKERFLEKVLVRGVEDCWEWQAAKDPAGYGRFWYKERMVPASQVAYKLFVGEVPKGLGVLHNCHNKGCCNPKHLRVGTQAENMGDVARARSHPAQKVNFSEARDFRKAGWSLGKIARYFNCSQQAIIQGLKRHYGTANYTTSGT